MKVRMLSMITVSFLLLGGSVSADEAASPEPATPDSPPPEETPAGGEEGALSETGEEMLITLRVPLFSPLFASTPVASVEDEPITLRDLTRAIASSHAGRGEATAAGGKDYVALLDRLLTAKLIVQEARNIGFDELPEVAAQIDDFESQLLIEKLVSRELESLEPDPAEVDRLYGRMSREYLLTTLEFAAEEDALAFLAAYEEEGDFTGVAMRFFDEGRAKGELGTELYVKLQDLLPAVAQTADRLEIGSLSQIFRGPEGFLLFYVRDIRPYESPELREEARRKVLEALRREEARKYADRLEARYATVDYALLDGIAFAPRRTGLPFFRREVLPDYEALRSDGRVLATVDGEEPISITVGDLARKVEASFYHGIELALAERRDVDESKRTLLKKMVFRRAALIEARRHGLDREEDYVEAVERNTTAVLFDTFVRRVVAPDVKVSDDEAQQYYREHVDAFSTPKMVRLDGLAFDALPDAERALKKLDRGADFRWVSANTEGQVDRDAESALDLNDVLVSVSSLPEGLQGRAERARQGDLLLYSGPDDNHYVIRVSKVFPPKPQPYEQARARVLESIVAEKVQDLVSDWGLKLREAYEPRIFLQVLGD